MTAALLVACTGGNDAGPSTRTTPAPSTSLVFRTNIDGQLKIGVLLPSTGAGATIGAPMIQAVSMAIDEINKAGGVFGRDVQFVTQDEGDSTITAAKAYDELIAAHVDAIIGPASSRIALSLINRILSNEVLTCSPSATAIALSDPTDDGYFIRTIPSDALQARALAMQINITGLRTTTVLYPEDDYGTRFANSLRLRLEGSKTVTLEPYDPANPADVAEAAANTAQRDPDTVAVLGDKSAASMIVALKNLGVGSPETPVFVDDAMRHPDLSATTNVPADALEGVMGTSPSVDPAPGSVLAAPVDWYQKEFAAFAPDTPMAFSAYAYDCANLIALAASSAQSDDGARMRQPAIDVSRNGQPCYQYQDCSIGLGDKRDIDLNGASGNIELDANGDPTNGQYDVFTIQGGRDVSTREPLHVP